MTNKRFSEIYNGFNGSEIDKAAQITTKQNQMIEFSEKQIKDGQNKAYLEAGHNAYFGNGFRAGIKFALDVINKSSVLSSIISDSDSLSNPLVKMQLKSINEKKDRLEQSERKAVELLKRCKQAGLYVQLDKDIGDYLKLLVD